MEQNCYLGEESNASAVYVACITMFQTARSKGMSDCDQGLLMQECAWWIHKMDLCKGHMNPRVPPILIQAEMYN